MHLVSFLFLSTRFGEQKLQGNNTRLCGSWRRGAAAVRSVVVRCGSGRRVEGISRTSLSFRNPQSDVGEAREVASATGADAKDHPSPAAVHAGPAPKVAAKAPPTRLPLVSGRNLGALFDEERSFSGGNSERRARVAASSGESGGDSGEERWRFQAEILRAECNFLQMEREVALRKLERNRAQMEATLRSAMETLVSGRKKIDGSENVGGAALEDEIQELEDKLEELQVERSGRRRGSESFRELQRSNARNFDRQASILRRRLEKMADETSVRAIREIAATEEKQYSDHHCRFLFISSSVTCKNTMGGGVEDTYGEDWASKDQPVTPWIVSVARSEIRSFPLLSS